MLQSLLLTVLFAIAPFQDGYLPPPPPPEIQHFIDVNLEWDTHAEGWDKVFAIQARPVVTLPVSEDASVYRGMGSDVEQWRTLISTQFPVDQIENALCVVNSESGGNPSAKNPNSNARGLFQVMTSVWGDYFGWTYEDFYVPELNVYAAARIWEMSGWVPWSPRTRRNCGL